MPLPSVLSRIGRGLASYGVAPVSARTPSFVDDGTPPDVDGPQDLPDDYTAMPQYGDPDADTGNDYSAPGATPKPLLADARPLPTGVGGFNARPEPDSYSRSVPAPPAPSVGAPGATAPPPVLDAPQAAQLASRPGPSAREQLEQLKTPIPKKVGIGRQLAAAGLSLIPGVNMTSIPWDVAQPGYRQALNEFNAKEADLRRQTGQEDKERTLRNEELDRRIKEAQLRSIDENRRATRQAAQQKIDEDVEMKMYNLAAIPASMPDGITPTVDPDKVGKYEIKTAPNGKAYQVPIEEERNRILGERKKADWFDMPKPIVEAFPGAPLRAPKDMVDVYAKLLEQRGENEKARAAKKEIADQVAELRREGLAIAAAAQSGRQDREDRRRGDQSYRDSRTELNKVGQPIDDLVARMGRLNETLAQKNMQADALVAPELLTVMAGGQNSGLRMNESELQRIVGGRTKWLALKAAAQQWSTDPKTATSIPDEQRQQIRALANAVNRKLLAKQKLLSDARNALIDADTPEEHRRIINNARQALSAIDQGGAKQAAPKYKIGDQVKDKAGNVLGVFKGIDPKTGGAIVE